MKSSRNNRDDFSKEVKRIVALRAGHHCSFRDCPQPTAGPSDESPTSVTMIGKAAHIHAASPGGRRYLEAMTRDERVDISNAIWLCANHADLIDRDEKTFSGDELRKMKREHEAKCAERQRRADLAGDSIPDLIALGPDIVFTGELISVDSATWSFRLQDFVDGDLYALLAFIDNYEETAVLDRYVLVNLLGDGRALAGAPSLMKETEGYIFRCPVVPRAARIRAADLPRDFALSENHDLMVVNGNIAEVSGLEALPQLVKTCLSHQKGESPFHRDFGTRLAEYYKLLFDSPWLGHFLKLEVIRQASIPYNDTLQNQQYTPLLCVERVFGVEILANAPTKNWLPIRVELDVKGVGRWQRELSVFIPHEPALRTAVDDLLKGA